MLKRIIFILITIYCMQSFSPAQAGIFELFLGDVQSPYSKSIFIDKKGMIIDDTFSVKKQCSYQFSLLFNHKKGIFDEYNELFNSTNFSIPFSIEVHRLKNSKTELIYSNQGVASLVGKGKWQTKFNMGQFVLDDGEYSVQLSFLKDNEILKGIDVTFNINIRPKTNC